MNNSMLKPWFLSILVLISCQSKNPEISSLSSEKPGSSLVKGENSVAATAMQRTLVLKNFADPEVLKVNDDLFFLSGTGARPESELPIYESRDLETFTFKRNYVPSSIDNAHNYCDLWAPDLSLHNGVYTIYFSARRVPKGQACPGPSASEPATFMATAVGPDLAFGVPQPIRADEFGPRTVFDANCPKDGCRNAIRIDADLVNDGDTRWLFYVWFERGNNISAFPMNDPGRVINNAGPAYFPTGGDEEGINEGPNVFRRGPHYYLFFSTGWFNSQYAMHYIMADSIDQLTRSRGTHRYSKAVRNSKGHLVESHGHNSIVERHGEFFNFFHQGFFNPDGSFAGRNTFKQRLHFRDDGTITSLNLVNLKWPALPNTEYSLDLVTRSGEVIGPCFNSSRLGRSTSLTYTGTCPSAGDRVIHKGDIAAFRLYWSDNGQWGIHWKDIPYDGFSDDVITSLP